MKKLLLFLFIVSSFFCPHAQNWQWAKSAGGAQNEYTCGTACDSRGNVYIAGIFYSPTIKFGSYVFNNVGNGDIFLVKYDPAGNLIWAKSYGGTGYDYPMDIFVDIYDNVYLCGEFASPTLVFGAYTLSDPAGDDFFAVKFDSAGTVLWANTGIIPYNPLGAKSIRADKHGNVYVTGIYESPTLKVGSYTLTNVSCCGAQGDIFLIKYNRFGNVVWAKSYGGRMDDRASGVAIDRNGNVLITGQFCSDTLKFGSFTLINDTTNNSSDVFIVKSDSLGNVIWAKSAGGKGWDDGIKIATDSNNNIIVGGDFWSRTFYNGNDTINNSNVDSTDIFLTELDPNGTIFWTKSAVGNGNKWILGLFVDSGNIYIAGAFSDPVLAFGSDTLRNVGGKDVYLTNYDISGNVIWAKANGGLYDDWGTGVTRDKSGNIYVTGYFNSSTIVFGSDTLINDTLNSTNDIFLAKIGANVLTNVRSVLMHDNFILYPNPNNGSFNLSIRNQELGMNNTVEIYNMLGEKIYSQPLNIEHSAFNINVGTRPSGIYLYRIVSEMGDVIGTGKFIVE